MLLLGITGPPGSGKTSLLLALAAQLRSQGLVCNGFVSRAEGGRAGARGAALYRLEEIASGETTLLARRDESLNPPYQFYAEAETIALGWMKRWPGGGVRLVDELGRREADGGGWMRFWPQLSAGSPAVLVASVREGTEAAIARQTGRAFDLVVDARSADAARRLLDAVLGAPDWVQTGRFGAASGALEWSAGSALHAAQVPLRGLAMSSLQTALLTAAAAGLHRRSRLVWVAFISAGLKALSPAGSRFRPMVAISMQGLLFTAVLGAAGWHRAGVTLAGFFPGAWAAAQGLVLQYLFTGAVLFRAADRLVQTLATRLAIEAPGLPWLLGGWIVLWGAVTGAAAFFAWGRLVRGLPVVPGKWTRIPDSALQAEGIATLPVWRDLARPGFWIPPALAAIYLAVSGSPASDIVLMVVRAAVLGWVVIALIYKVHPLTLPGRLRRLGWNGPASAAEAALRRFRPPDAP